MSFEQPRTISAYQFPKIYSVDFNWSKSEGRWPSLEMEHSALIENKLKNEVKITRFQK